MEYTYRGYEGNSNICGVVNMKSRHYEVTIFINCVGKLEYFMNPDYRSKCVTLIKHKVSAINNSFTML